MTNNTNTRIYKFLAELQKTIPNFNIKFKDESMFMKILSYILFFNNEFMINYITTIGSTVYFPSKFTLESNVDKTQILLSHEFVHAFDKKNNKLFQILYLFPQILTPLFLIMFFILPNFYNIISLIMAITFLLPIIPAFWRSKAELRGYKISLFASSELMKENNSPLDKYNSYLNERVMSYNSQFTGSEYYWMNRSGVIAQLNDTVEKIKTDDILKDDVVYSIVREAFKNSKL